jgi:hypothetical protein
VGQDFTDVLTWQFFVFRFSCRWPSFLTAPVGTQIYRTNNPLISQEKMAVLPSLDAPSEGQAGAGFGKGSITAAEATDQLSEHAVRRP